MNGTEATVVTGPSSSSNSIAHSVIYHVRLTAEDVQAENCTENAVCR